MTLNEMFGLKDETLTQKVQRVVDAFEGEFGTADGPTQMELIIATAAILANRKVKLIGQEDKWKPEDQGAARLGAIFMCSERLSEMMLKLLARDGLAALIESLEPRRKKGGP